MDNLRLHKNPDVPTVLRSRRCRGVFVPPYGRDTNPIELAFSKSKHLVRKATATCMNALRRAFQTGCAAVLPRDARNYIRHAGYF